MNELELLKKHKELALRLIDAKDEELDFLSDHPNCDFWDEEQEEEHTNILNHVAELESQLNEVNGILKKFS